VIRVRTILVLGYWVLGNIHRHWVVLLLGDIFCCSDTQYSTNQRPVSTAHMPVNDYLVPLLPCTLTDAVICLDTMLICCCLLNTIIVINIEFWDFSWSLLCYILVSVLVLGIGIARGQYYWVYWILGAFLGIVLTLLVINDDLVKNFLQITALTTTHS